MTATTPAVGRIDHIVRELEQLHAAAQSIFDAHINCVRLKTRSPLPFGNLKYRELAGPAGSALNYIAALKIVREKIAE